MRIAIIGKKYPFCGIVTYCRELVRALREEGHTVAFYYMHNEAAELAFEESLPYRWRNYVYVLPQSDAAGRLEAHLRAFRPDVVHASFALSFLDFALPALCRKLDVPLVATFHPAFDSRPTFPNRICSLIYRIYAPTLASCDRVVIFSEAQRERLARLGVAPERITVVPNGVDTARYTPGPSRFKAEIGARLLVTYMGRLDPEKNVGALLRAFAKLRLGDDVHLALMGDGVLAHKLRARYGQVPHLHWLGFVREEERRIDVLRGSDVFVLPSSVEGLSIALLEAMACGAAPLATDVGADGEVIAGCGVALDPEHLKRDLAPALAGLLADGATRARLGAAARRRVERRYAFARNVETLVGLYEQVRQERRAGRRAPSMRP